MWNLYVFWIYQINKNANYIAQNENYLAQRPVCDGGVENGGLLILLGIITCGIYNLYFYYKIGSLFDYVTLRKTGVQSSNAVLFIVLGILIPIVTIALAQNEINKYVDSTPLN